MFTNEQKAEIERLASLLATARVIRTRFRLGDYPIPGATAETCEARVKRANAELSAYLATL